MDKLKGSTNIKPQLIYTPIELTNMYKTSI